MSEERTRGGLFPALLKHWRGRRGMSQLDLALAADVSSRHISFLETGRSTPSPEMVARLSAALDVSLRHANAMARAAGHEAIYPERALTAPLPGPIQQAIELMKSHHDPYPFVVVDRLYEVLDVNEAAMALFAAMAPQAAASGRPLNLARSTFEPGGAGEALENFEEVGRALLWRLQREALAQPSDGELRALLDEVLAMPTVSPRWREVDLTVPSPPVVAVHCRVGERVLRFVTTITAFQAPQIVALDELRIEMWLPLDEETAQACRELVG